MPLARVVGDLARRSSVVAGTALLVAACSFSDAKNGAVADVEAPAAASVGSAEPGGAGESPRGLEHFEVVAARANLLLRGKGRPARGSMGGVRGSLEVDWADLTQTRGTIEVDLSTLQTTTFEDAAEDAAQTKQLLDWFEVDARSPAEPLNRRWLTFRLHAVASADPTDLFHTADSQRVARLVTEVELSLHGVPVRYPATLLLNAAFDGVEARTVHLQTALDLPFKFETHGLFERNLKNRATTVRVSRAPSDVFDAAVLALSAGFEPAGARPRR